MFTCLSLFHLHTQEVCLHCSNEGIYNILINLPFFRTILTHFGKNNTLADAKIIGKYNEPRIIFVYLYIQKFDG